MKLNDILSSDLPEIDESVKACVNSGQWLLFKTEAKFRAQDEGAYYLKTGEGVFALNERGKILRQLSFDGARLEINELFYFADLPKPSSLSNSIMAEA